MPTTPEKPLAPRTAEGVVWAVRQDGIVVIELSSERTLTLDCLQGAVWELVIEHGVERAILQMRAIGGWTEDEAEEFVAACLGNWVAQGWFATEGATVEGGRSVP